MKLGTLLWLAAAGALASQAQIVHRVRFAEPAKVLVWEDQVFLGEGAALQLNGGGATDFDLPGSGQLVSFAPGTSETRLFTIASNAPFEIRASSALEANRVTVRVMEAGPNARAAVGSRSLDPQVIFLQSERTAQRPGQPRSQAITLELSWSGPAPRLSVTAL